MASVGDCTRGSGGGARDVRGAGDGGFGCGRAAHGDRDVDRGRPCWSRAHRFSPTPGGCGHGRIATDLDSSTGQIIARYADRWSIEQTIKDGKDSLGAGDAQSRLPAAVERTAPFMF
jgi:hypothetical protein